MTRLALTSALVGLTAAGPAVALDLVPSVVHEAPSESGSYQVSSVLTIGGPDADEPAQFFEKLGPVAVDAASDGRIYVLDNGNAQVQVFDAEGGFVRSIGQEGQGPGEFQLPMSFSVNGPGDVAVYDMSTQRLSIFDAAGELVRDQVFDEGVGDILLHDDRSLTATFSTGRPAAICTYGPKGDVAWMYEKAKTERPQNERVMNFKIGGGGSLAATDSHLFLGSEAAYAVLPLTLDGSPGDVFARTYERQPFELRMPSADDGEDGPRVMMIKKEVTTDSGATGTPGGTKTDISFSTKAGEIDMDHIKKMMPEFTHDLQGIMTWPDGRLWLITSDSDDDKMKIDEWSSDGQYLRQFDVAGNYARLHVGSDGELYAVSHDDDDFPIVHRMSVSPNF